MVRSRFGRTQLGCLVMTLLLSAAGYFAVSLGGVLFDYYRYVDRMKSEVRFAASRSDAVIKRRVAAYADSIGLPESARRVHVKRGNKLVTIWAEYYHNIEFPGFVREIRFSPQATGPF